MQHELARVSTRKQDGRAPSYSGPGTKVRACHTRSLRKDWARKVASYCRACTVFSADDVDRKKRLRRSLKAAIRLNLSSSPTLLPYALFHAARTWHVSPCNIAWWSSCAATSRSSHMRANTLLALLDNNLTVTLAVPHQLQPRFWSDYLVGAYEPNFA